jgi:hypothetical protein
MRKFPCLMTVLAALLACGPVWAQQTTSLAELARREAERRKTVKSTGKVYTNSDVKRGVPLTTAVDPASSRPADAQPAPAASAPAPETAKTPGAAAEETRDEAWWRKRMSDLRDQLNRNRLFAEALQSRINALWADFTARDDPAQRAVIERSRGEALAELERVKTEIARQEQAIADLDDEARKANVPPGWLR